MKNILIIPTLFLLTACQTIIKDEPEIEKVVEDGAKEHLEFA